MIEGGREVVEGCAWEYGKGMGWENRARGGGEDWEIEEIAPKALFNFTLMMGPYFPCAVAIISLTHIHSRCHTLSASHSCISLHSFLLHSCYVLPPLSLFTAPHWHLKIQSIVSHLHQLLFPSPVCACGGIHQQGTHRHGHVCRFTSANFHVNICCNVFIHNG